MITVGQLLAGLLALAFLPSWKLMLGVGVIPSVSQLLEVSCLPESPRWLIKEGHAEKVIEKVYKPDFTSRMMKELETEAAKHKNETELTEAYRLHDLFTTYRRCLAIGCGIQIAQQFTGIKTAMYYGPTMMIAANFKINK